MRSSEVKSPSGPPMITKMSGLFLRTLREDPADAEVTSHKLLVRAGYVRRIAPGVYSWLPLGQKVLRNVERQGFAEIEQGIADYAKKARDGGLRRVGVLDSSRYASLHPGYYVIFHGVFETEAEASSALQRARAVFPTAYQREIVP